LARGALKVAIYAVAAAMIFFGIVFVISSNLGAIYLVEGIILIGIAAGILVLTREKKTIEIKQSVELGGGGKVKEIRCPNCSAYLDPSTIRIIDGKPYLTCKYCGNKFELTEEPKW